VFAVLLAVLTATWSKVPAAAATPAAAVAPAGRTATDIRALVQRLGREQGVDPRLMDAVIRVESDYDPRAVSRRGAQGLMQLMPATSERLDVQDPFDPEQTLRGGARELSRLINRYSGNLPLALAAYNAGEGAVERYRGVPPYRETLGYVTRVMTIYTGRQYRLPANGYRIVPVRMVRDSSGRTVITNHPRGKGSPPTATRATSGDGPLGGGFGSR
jgi:soluble lytic murein transglycosylase-like protein